MFKPMISNQWVFKKYIFFLLNDQARYMASNASTKIPHNSFLQRSDIFDWLPTRHQCLTIKCHFEMNRTHCQVLPVIICYLSISGERKRERERESSRSEKNRMNNLGATVPHVFKSCLCCTKTCARFGLAINMLEVRSTQCFR